MNLINNTKELTTRHFGVMNSIKFKFRWMFLEWDGHSKILNSYHVGAVITLSQKRSNETNHRGLRKF